VRRALWIILAVVLLVSCGLLFPCLFEVRDGEGWVRSANSVHMIGLALQSYQDENGHLPPAVVRNKEGQPLYSWRVLLLPYLDQDPLFQEFNRDEPWDSEHNKKLLKETPRCYRPFGGSDDAPGLTRYQVFIGPGTPFERNSLRLDGFKNTILVVEAGEPVPWSKPVDLTYDPASPLPPLGGVFKKPVHFLCYEIAWTPGFTACFTDGTTQFIPSDTDERALPALISRTGG
jgi:hypothetical protein